MQVPQAALADPPAPAALGELIRLFRAVDAEGIRYCHWKSNEHLRASMVGETDLDVLVDRRAAQPLARVLSRTTFKRFSTVPRRSYPGIESYVGLDADSGALIHLHLHYQLTLGERDLKGYRIPWEERLLSTRVMDEAEGVYVVDPSLELLLLVVRVALKLRVRDWLLAGLGRPYVRGGVLRELRWLAARVEPERLEESARELVGERAGRLLREMVPGPAPTIGQLVRFARAVEPALREYRIYGTLGARSRRWSRECRRVLADRALRTLGLVVPTRRLLPHGGRVIAFIGADGSGKSTLASAISHWLSGLVDVLPIYFGTGQGPASPPRRALEGVASLLRRTSETPTALTQASGRGTSSSTVRTIGELLWVWSVAEERRKRAARARRARDCGMIVVCDRFPHSQSVGNDGPCLGHWIDHPSWARRTVARHELAATRVAERLHPDLVVKLNVSPEVALQRKPETPPTMLHRKLRVLEGLRLADETRVIEVDATRPFEQVLLEAKRAVWSSL